MVTAITQGIKISVDTRYQEDYSNPEKQHFMFAYQITIENLSDDSYQLMRRHWYIFDAAGEKREVEGEGVIGLQPVLHSGENYKYVSGCNLTSEFGTMHGNYIMRRLSDDQEVTVDIPEFQLVVPYKLN